MPVRRLRDTGDAQFSITPTRTGTGTGAPSCAAATTCRLPCCCPTTEDTRKQKSGTKREEEDVPGCFPMIISQYVRAYQCYCCIDRSEPGCSKLGLDGVLVRE